MSISSKLLVARRTAIKTAIGRAPYRSAKPNVRSLPSDLGSSKRYQSDLDDYYLAARLAIESSRAEEVIYAGFASHVFANVLSRHFKRACLADFADVVACSKLVGDAARVTLWVLHIDLPTFTSTFLHGGKDDWMLSSIDETTSMIIIVEAPDSQGGLGGFDHADWRSRFEVLQRRAKSNAIECRAKQTTFGFFHGHPGFIVELQPAAPTLERQFIATQLTERAASALVIEPRLQPVNP